MAHTIRGLVPILATPFAPDGSLDLASLRRLTEFQLDSEVDGVAVMGMASEAFALTTGERTTVMREVQRVTAGALPVVCGVAATSTVTAIEQVRQAELDGAAAVMVLPPYMVKPSAAGVAEFYAEVADASHSEVMVQDAPAVTGVSMTTGAIAALSEIPRVTSVKVEAPPTPPKIAAIVGSTSASFAVLGGMNSQSLPQESAAGAVGTMPACEFADILAGVVKSLSNGRVDEAHATFTPLLPLLLFGGQPGLAWAVHKEVLVQRGLIRHATVREPAQPLDPVSRAALAQLLASLQLPALSAPLP